MEIKKEGEEEEIMGNEDGDEIQNKLLNKKKKRMKTIREKRRFKMKEKTKQNEIWQRRR